VSIQRRTGSIRGLRAGSAVRGTLLALLCLALLGAESRATALCIDRGGVAGIEAAFAGRCAGCDDEPLARAGEPSSPGSELRAAACDGCLDLDVAGIEQGARRELGLARLAGPVLPPALHALPSPAAPLAPARRALEPDASPGALARSRILRC
jgi:hypothetical protein